MERASDLPSVIQLRTVITLAQESLVNKFQLIKTEANNQMWYWSGFWGERGWELVGEGEYAIKDLLGTSGNI